MNNLPSPDIVVPDMWITLLKSAAMLCVVLGILLMVLFVMKRLFHSQGVSSRRGLIKVLSSHYISPKEKILLLDVMGEKILIGATTQCIQRIAKIKGSEEFETSEPVEKSSFFLELLKGKMGAGKNNRDEKSQKPPGIGS